MPKPDSSEPGGSLFTDEAGSNNLWYDSAHIEDVAFNPSLKSDLPADVVIIGGGFTGLAAACYLMAENPNLGIVLLESDFCGSGASGRSGGFADTSVRGLWRIWREEGPEKARGIFDITVDGLESIRHAVERYGIHCDFAANGSMELATEHSQIALLEQEKKFYDALGLEAEMIGTDQLRKAIRSERYVGAIRYPYGATLNPFKFVRGMKRVAEGMGVQIYERSPAVRIRPGSHIKVETENGHVRAAALVVATNAYSPSIGFFRRRIIPMCGYVIATEPLAEKQMASIGWSGREKLSDMNTFFDYFHLSPDNRIVFGGAGLRYLYGGRICTKLHRPSVREIEKHLLHNFPQLEGIRITHRWGGTLGMSLDLIPSVGTLKGHRNIYYAAGYSGEGTVLSQVAAKIIAELYGGASNALNRLFFVNKGFPYAWPEPVRYLGIKAYGAYLKRFRPKLLY